MSFVRGRRIALASIAISGAFVGAEASAQDVPATVEPGVIEQEFRAVPERYADGAVSVPSASGPMAPAGAENQRFVLRELTVDGVTAFSAEEIRGLYGDQINQEISLADLFAVAQNITRHYSDSGYPLSVAFVPAQQIEGGAARIMVYEGYVAEVEIAGDAGPARPMLENLAAQLMGERPLSAAVLERYVLLANDVPGVRVQAVIDRGDGEPGAVKVIFAAEREAFNFAVNFNNRGSRALGPFRVQASAALNGLAIPGDQLRGDVVQAWDTEELAFLAAGYNVPIGADGLRVGLSGTWSDSEPGTDVLEALDFNSDGWTAMLDASYPLVRSRARNVVVGGSFEYKELESRFDDVVNSNDILWVGRGNLAFDTIGPAGGVTSLFLQVSQGFDIGAATHSEDLNKSRDRGSAIFSSLLLDAGHVHPLNDNFEVAISGRAQVASRKLLASEECGYGGGVGRAFDNFEISGDHCLMGSAELRRHAAPVVGELTAAPYGFFDVGHVWTHGAVAAGEVKTDEGQSVGAGVRLGLGDALSAYLEFAQPISHDVALEDDRNGRVFFGLTARR